MQHQIELSNGAAGGAPVSIPQPRDIMTERLSGSPSKAGDPVPTDELVMEHRLRWRVKAGSDKEAGRTLDESARTVKRAWEE